MSLADFQGGLVLWESVNGTDQITKVDGQTGLKRVIYTLDSTATLTGYLAVHPDGTVFICQQNETSDYHPLPWTVVGIDSAAGGQKFSVTIPRNGSLSLPFAFIIAGDGYAYTGYMDAEIQNGSGMDGPFPVHIELIRVDSSGASDTLAIKDYTTTYRNSWWGEGRRIDGAMITNADQGVLLSWTIAIAEGGTNYVDMAVTNGTDWTLVNGQMLPDQYWAPVPVVQAQDGSYVGTASVMTDPTGSPAPYMVAFDQSGSLRWSVAGNYQPQIATEDGGVIATDDSGAAVAFDRNGNATGQIDKLTQSWTGKAYRLNPVQRIAATVVPVSMSLWTTAGGNASGNHAAASLMPSAVIVSLLPSWDEARSYMPGVLANAIRVVQQLPACAEVFGTADSRTNGFDPVAVLTALYRNIETPYMLFQPASIVGGKPVSSAFAYGWALNGNEGVEFTGLYIGTSGFATGPRVWINVDNWIAEGRNSGMSLIPMTEVILHEMGHVYNDLRTQGSGGSQIIQNDAGNGLSSENTQLIYRKCFP